MKEHELAELINEITSVAVKYKDTQQLRSRISGVIVPVIRQLSRMLCDKHKNVQGSGMCSACIAEIKNKEIDALYRQLYPLSNNTILGDTNEELSI